MPSNTNPERALLGYTGFVGGQLDRQAEFEARFNSQNIGEAGGRSYDLVVCAAAPGSMFEANRFPERDAAAIEGLIDSLRAITARQFVLISSIAVLADFAGGDDEATEAFQQELAYGRNRRALEAFCADHFASCLIVRLPALFGSGLKKNFLFDILNPMPTMLVPPRYEMLADGLPAGLRDLLPGVYRFSEARGVYEIDRAAVDASGQRPELEAATDALGLSAIGFTAPDSQFQFYDMSGLWRDIARTLDAGLDTIHLAPEPISAGDVFRAVTGREMPDLGARKHREDMRTAHADLWGLSGPYIADAATTRAALETFIASEKDARR